MLDPGDICVGTEEHLQAVLRDISFEKSCLDMGWLWGTRPVYAKASEPDELFPAGRFEIIGWLVSTTFQRPDRDDGKIMVGRGREWFVKRGDTVSGVVKTCFAAAKMIVEHEIMEAFKWRGARVFDPHNGVGQLAALQKPEPRAPRRQDLGSAPLTHDELVVASAGVRCDVAEETARMFPLLFECLLFDVWRGPNELPWAMVLAHEAQALRNHDQTVQRLAERGGLSPCEACAVLEDRPWRRMSHDEARTTLERLLAQWSVR